MNENLALRTIGTLDISHVLPDGEHIHALTCRNAIQKTARQATARCLAVPGARIDKMYMLYTIGDIPQINGIEGSTVEAFDIVGSVEGTSLNYCRVPVIHTGEADGGSSVIFHGISGDEGIGPGAGLNVGARMYAAALACSVDSNPAKDIIFSVALIEPSIMKLYNAQLGIRWKVKIVIGEE